MASESGARERMEEGVPPSPQAQSPYEGLVKRLRAAGVGDHDVRLVEQLLLLAAPHSESVSTTTRGGHRQTQQGYYST